MGSANPQFPTTSWTLIRKVQKGDEREATAAMEEICRQYWYPVYAFNRRQGFGEADAEDLTQDFFRALVTRETIQAAREEKGRLRSFMLNMLREMNANHRRSRATEKRGGRAVIVSLDETDAEERYRHEPAGITDPARLFDRAWAERLLAAATERLREDFEEGDNLEDFEQLREYLPLGDQGTPYAAAAAKLGVKEGALRLQIHRMRKRYAKHLEAEIAQTVADPAEQKAELAYLLEVVGR
ncbi:MAG: sigma-70 family RNA polymerase sigma factor [Verrucomicrobiae bacterium]|nr:sigma-70 family RNA polymerase sigma factor [Verrucomicrobiae bacterium]